MGVALPFVMIAATVASGVMTAAAQRRNAIAQSQQSHYQAAVARNNQIAAEHAARDAEARGRQTAADIRRKQSAVTGAQRAQLAAAGVDVSSGTALSLTEETAGLAAQDIAVARNNAAREALGFRNQGSNFNAEVGLRQSAGANALASGNAAATGTLLTTAGSAATKWYDLPSNVRGF